MTGTLRITADVEGADAALAVAAALDELASAVSAFEAAEDAALWRVEAYPRAPLCHWPWMRRLAANETKTCRRARVSPT